MAHSRKTKEQSFQFPGAFGSNESKPPQQALQ